MAYIAGAVLFSVLAAVAQGFNITTAEGFGAAMGLVIVGAIMGGLRRLFGPTNIPKWMFWVSLIGLIVNAAARTTR